MKHETTVQGREIDSIVANETLLLLIPEKEYNRRCDRHIGRGSLQQLLKGGMRHDGKCKTDDIYYHSWHALPGRKRGHRLVM